MKIILYVTMYTFLWRTSSRADSTDSDNKYDLFENMQLERTAFGFKKITAWDFRDLKSPYSLTLSNNITLKRQYAINTVFKLYEVKSWCIFSIVNPQGKTKLSVCITPVNMQIVKISIEGLIEKDIDFFHEMEVKDNWITIQIFVNENLVSHRVNCTNNLDKAEIPEKDVVLSTEDQVLIGKSNSASNSGSFQAIVEEITIYSPSDDSTLATICDQSDLNDYDTDIFGGPGKFDKGDVGEKGDKGDQGDRGDKGDKGEKGDKGGVGIQGDKGEKGEKGQKGYKGDQGNAIKGPEGPIGPIGPAGLKGPPGNMGPEGVCSCSEELVSHLLLSMPKMRGPPGDKGPPGLNGTTGTPGDIGPVGPKGEPGLNGAKGETGERGYYGRPGKDGKEGPKGEPGKDGVPGERGPRGETGDPGKPGGTVMGPIGPKGEPGKDGNKGEKGDPGKDGSNGIPGNHGIDGKKGDKGDKGEAGLNGMLGKAGTPGKDGQKGDMGERGFKGDKGAPGLPGLSPTWVSLLDETLNPEANATIVKILKDYKGDKGDKAEKGQKGERGDKGDVGTAGIDGKDGSPGKRGDIGPKGDIGPIGPIGLKGDRGEPGLPGSVPASEIALSKGSKGDRGDPGRIGNRGPRGFTGIKGASGPKGPMGIKGDKGSTGSVGPVGPPGKDGIPGTKGEKGAPPDIDLLKFKGEKGDKGNDGIKGEPGVPGPQGPIGLPGTSAPESFPVIGSPGPPGPPGPPGQPGTSIIGPKGEPGKLSLDSFDSEDFYITSTVVFRNKHLLLAQKSTTLQIGTLAYVIQERILLVKVEDGWQYVKSGRYYIRNNAFIGQENRLVTKPIDDVKQYSTTLKPRFKHREQRCLKLVALNHPYSGKVHRAHDDIAGYSVVADKCFKQKSAAKLPGTYEPFLTSRIRDLNALVPETLRHLPVMNLKNEMLFESWNSMFNGSDGVFNKSEFNLYSFNGKIANKDSTWRNRIVWHGSEARGVRSSYDCDEWSSDQKNLYGYASRLDSGKLLERARYPCWKSFIILCVEINSDICINDIDDGL